MINQPNRTEEVEVNDQGFGRKLINGVHHLEMEMIRVVGGAFGVPSAKPGTGPNNAHLEVIGAAPSSTVTVEFHSPHETPAVVTEVADPIEEVPADPEPEPAPTPTADELVDAHTKDELAAKADEAGVEVKASDTKADIAEKLVGSSDGDD